MHSPGPAVEIPAAARARALGALVPRGDHAVAFASAGEESLLQGFALEGLEAGDRVLVLADRPSPRAIAARLRSAGVAAPRDQPGALRVLATARLGPLSAAIPREAAAAEQAGHEGLRLAHLVAPGAAQAHRAEEARLPRRFASSATVLCLYTPASLSGGTPADAWALARSHARILCL